MLEAYNDLLKQLEEKREADAGRGTPSIVLSKYLLMNEK